MSLIDTTRIERKAVIAVEQLFLDHSNTIEPHVATGDTEISFDGKAILFSNDEITKESYFSSIPVQVKGTEVEKFSDKTAKFYKFDKQTFKNFQLEDGAVDSWLLRIIPSNIRSSVITTINALFTLSIPLGTGVFGYLLNIVSTPIILILTGAVTLLGSAIFLLGELKGNGVKNNEL